MTDNVTQDELDAAVRAADATPYPKVAAAGAAGALTTVLVFALGQAGVEITAEVAAAVTTLLAFLAGYLKSD